MSKPKGATRSKRIKRAQTALDYIVRYRVNSTTIVEMLLKQEPGLSDRSAWRAIEDARKLQQTLSAKPSPENLGLLMASLDDIYGAEQRAEKPDRALLNQMIRTGIGLYKINSQIMKGPSDDEQHETASATLSPGLENALKRLQLPEAGEKPIHTDTNA